MTEFELVGFVADLDGSQAEFFTGDPVLRVDDTLYVTETPQWERADLRSLSSAAFDYVEWVTPSDEWPPTTPGFHTTDHPIRRREQFAVNEGEVVWLLGPDLAERLAAVNRPPHGAVEQFKREIDRWHRTERLAFSWTTGSRRDFHTATRAPISEIVPLLHRALFDRVERSHGNADEYLHILRGLTQEDTAEYLLTVALYHREERDEQRLQAIARRATRGGFAESAAAFLNNVEERADRLATRRLSEIAEQRNSLLNPELQQAMITLSTLLQRDTNAVADRLRLVLEGDDISTKAYEYFRTMEQR